MNSRLNFKITREKGNIPYDSVDDRFNFQITRSKVNKTGTPVIIMGDFNAHTGLDQSKVDTAGRLLLDRTECLGLHMLNGTSTCKGNITRTEEQANGKCISATIDYVLVSLSLLPHVESMIIHDDRMGSDHHSIIVKLRNLQPKIGPRSSPREVWRVGKIPHHKDKAKQCHFRR